MRGNAFSASRYMKYPDGKAKKERKYFSSFAEAKAFRKSNLPVDAQVATAQDGSTLLRQSTEVLFVDLVERWKNDWLPHKAISTQIRYQSYVKHFKYFWNMSVEKIEPTDIDGWIAYLKRPEYLVQGNPTRCDYHHEFSVLRRIFNYYASRFNRNYRQPFIPEHRRMLKVKEKTKVEKDLTVAEVQLFISKLREMVMGTRFEVTYYVALTQYAIYSRVQEVAALHYEDFHFGRNEIVINKKAIWPRMKGMKPFIEAGAKTNGGKKIPMSALARRVVQEWALKSGTRTGLLFQMNGKMLTYRQIDERYTQALRAAGLPFTSTHVLRHASLTEFYDSCKDLLQTQKVAGHRDLRATTRYAKVRDERIVQTQLEVDKKQSCLLI
ncbi:site-specific integrase [Bdellovibrionota bacterium FG-2]